MPTPDAQLTNTIRYWLQRQHLTLVDLAEMTGLPYETVRRIARARSDPALDTALLISETLSVPFGTLFRLHPDARAPRSRIQNSAPGPRSS